MSELPTGVVILAGGSSSRMGRPKQLLVYKGTTLLRRAAENALALACGPVVIVTGALHQELIDACHGLPVTFKHNKHWLNGMSTSVKIGLEALEAARLNKVGSVLLMLCDQPLITVEHLQRLLEVFRESAGIIATAYAGITGVPAVFSREFFGELNELTGDKGARALFAKHQQELKIIDFEYAGVDVDTLEDWERLSDSKV